MIKLKDIINESFKGNSIFPNYYCKFIIVLDEAGKIPALLHKNVKSNQKDPYTIHLFLFRKRSKLNKFEPYDSIPVDQNEAKSLYENNIFLPSLITKFKKWSASKTFTYAPFDIKMLSENTIKEIEKKNEEINIERLFYSDFYLEEVAEKLGIKFPDFNQLFWQYPRNLYHCSPKENLESIQKFGLQEKNETRGFSSNKYIGRAIFTTQEFEELDHLQSSYGELIITINTKQMKTDGFILEVEREPDWERAEKLTSILHKLGKDKYEDASRYVDSSEGTSPFTVIVYGNIPPKYLKIEM
jgi:hypothetical protein